MNEQIFVADRSPKKRPAALQSARKRLVTTIDLTRKIVHSNARQKVWLG